MSAETFRAPGRGIWTLDRAHFPRPAAPYIRSAVAAGVSAGVTASFRRYGYPLKGVVVRWIQGRCYFRIEPIIEAKQAGPSRVTDLATWLTTRLHPEFRRRNAAAGAAFDQRLWVTDLATWRRVDEPRLRRRNLRLQAVEPDLLDDGALTAHLAEVTENLRDGLRVHYELFPAYAIPLGELVLAGERWGCSAAELLRALRGRSPGSADPRRRIDEIVAALPDPLAIRSVADVRAAGPAAAAALEDYLAEYGNQVIGSLDVDDLTVGELPELLVSGIRAAGARDTGDADGAALVEQLRARVPAGGRAAFDELLDQAAKSFEIRDRNVGVTELWPAGLVRRALRAAGRRLAERGRIADWTDVFEAEPAELARLLAGRGLSADELRARAAERRRQAAMLAPRLLGVPGNGNPDSGADPPDPARALRGLPGPLARIGRIMATMAPLYESPPAQAPLSGTGVGSRAYVGPAKVVRDATEALRRLQPGDVLITGTTTPAFNTVLPIVGAFVVEHGGAFSHSAIMANELGVPAVIGVNAACELIRDGQEIEVDPVAGLIRVRV